MAVLSDNDRAECSAEFQRTPEFTGGTYENFPITKTQFREVINAIDQWADDNQSSFNTAIPQPQRGLLSTRQKLRLFMLVLRRRFEVS